MGYKTLKNVYAVSELFFCNVQEAQKILNTQEKDIVQLLRMMRELGPEIVVITDGPQGAYVYDGKEAWHMPMYPDPAPPVDRTGAGDSFASTFTSALALGKTIPEALTWAPVNSMSVVQKIGAQEGLLTLSQLEEYLKNAPEDYKPMHIN
ncbi:MAG: carbohydrate kinase family protein [Bacteroidetes bacterium]|nr:carbohydrate kinase family protein [Bacteroidota bacterium]